MAASNVFAVPELLESVLQYLPSSAATLYTTYTTTWLKHDEPVPAPEVLFAVQRVSRAFRDAICGSHLIHRLMFLEPVGATFGGRRDKNGRYFLRSTLFWLANFKDVEILEEGESKNIILNASILYANMLLSGRRLEASWRQIQMGKFLDSGPMIVDYKMEKRFEAKMVEEWDNDSTRLKLRLRYMEPRVFKAMQLSVKCSMWLVPCSCALLPSTWILWRYWYMRMTFVIRRTQMKKILHQPGVQFTRRCKWLIIIWAKAVLAFGCRIFRSEHAGILELEATQV